MEWKVSDFQEPQWKNSSDFMDSHFHKFSNMSDFLTSLENFENSLRNQLSNIINDDYTEFVLISRQLIQLSDNINQIIKTLKQAEETIESSAEILMKPIESVKPQLDQLKKVRRDSAVCKLALETIDSLKLIEKMLITNEIDSLLDAAIGLSIVNAKIKSIDQPAMNVPLSSSYQKLREVYKSVLKDWFCKCITEKKELNDLMVVFSAACLSQDHELLYKVYEDRILSIFVLGLKEGKLVNKNSIKWFPELTDYILSVSDFLKNTPEIYDFMLNSIWPFFSKFLNSNIIFPIGTMDEIKTNFELFKKFISVVEQSVKSQENVMLIRNSEYYSNLYNKVHLDIYGQFASMQVLKEVNDIFSEKNEPLSESCFKLSITQKIYTIISNLFTTDIVISDVVKDFIIIVMKILYSYQNYCAKQTSHSILIVIDMEILSRNVFSALPEKFRDLMILPSKCLLETSRQMFATKIVNEATDKLFYINTLSTQFFKKKDSVVKKPTSHMIEAINVYNNWVKLSGTDSEENVRIFVDALITKFSNESKEAITKMRNTKISMEKIKSNNLQRSVVDIGGAKSQLLLDLEQISMLAKCKNYSLNENDTYKKILQFLRESESDVTQVPPK